MPVLDPIDVMFFLVLLLNIPVPVFHARFVVWLLILLGVCSLCRPCCNNSSGEGSYTEGRGCPQSARRWCKAIDR